MSLLLSLLLVAPAVAAPGLKDPPKASKAVVYQSITTAQLEALIEAKGWAYETVATPGSNTALRVELGGYKVVVFMTDQGSGVADDLQLYAGFSVDETPTPTVINSWNMGRRFCNAYVDSEGDPVLESDVDLGGGVLAPHITQQLELFGANVLAYAQHIGFGQ